MRKSTGFEYKFLRMIRLMHRHGLFIALLLVHSLSYAQVTPISGIITDDKGQPLADVSITVKGTTTGTVTDAEGHFSISVPSSKSTLVVSYSGFETREIVAGSQRIINAQLQLSRNDLDQVVVIGYGTQKKSDLTGAIGSIKAQQLQERSSPSLAVSLAGRVPGVQVNVNSGRPGGKTNIRVRGFSSINSSNNPLYVIDGVILPIGDQAAGSQAIDYINPNDIVSVEVLKDASATAIYGARGANGVILVTTKRGKPGVSEITYNGDYSIPKLGPNYPQFLNAKEFLSVEDLAYKNMEKYDSAGWASGKYISRNPALARTDPRLFDANQQPLYDTKWIDEATQHRLSQNQQVGFSGGSDHGSYAVSLGYRDDEGLIKSSYLKRYSARFTFDDQIKKWIRVGGTLSYVNQEENIVDQDYSAFRAIAEAFPFLPVKFPDGTWADNRLYPNAEVQFNPVHWLEERKYIMNTQNTMGSIYSNLSLAKGLEMRTVLGTNIVTRGINQFTGRTLAITQNGTASASNSRENFWSLENYLTYNKTIAKDHTINALLGISWQETNSFTQGEGISNFSSDYFQYNNLGAGSTSPTYSSGRSRYSFSSYFGRVNYAYKNKYLVTFTGRQDGSSKFGENNKYAFFPSAALAWRASEEDFLKNNNLISNLKIRTSYGLTGNSEIPPYSSLSTLSSNYTGIFNDTRVGGTGINRLANPALKWEKTAQTDLGIELGILNNRISFEADLYYRKTTDMLLDAPVPQTSGYASIRRNVGSMENKGLDLALNTVNITTDKITWSTTFNISMNRNKVLSLATPSDIVGVGGVVFISPTNIIRVGEPVGSFKGLVRLGVWSEAERAEAASYVSYRSGLPVLPGDIKYADLNGDHAITDADRKIIGNGSPKGWGSFINNVRYKQWDFLLDIQYSYGNNNYELSTGSSEDRVALANSYKTVLNAWTPEHENTVIPEIRDTRAGYIINEDTHWLKDASFIRGRNVMLGYTFGSSTIGRWRLSRLRVYSSVQNFFLICSGEVNGDPETVGTTFGTGAFSQGLTYHAYPKSTTFLLGLQVAL
jgi:TonB-linked SusC/RagA family outer membrane protein